MKVCPEGYYANPAGNCVIPTACDLLPQKTYGDNSTTKCVDTCPAGSFADDVSRYCIAVCPDPTFGENLKCVSSCQTTSTIASNITQLCSSICPNYTYAYNGHCYDNCSSFNNTYQNDVTHICDNSCPAGLFADPTTHRCVVYCPTGYYRKSSGTSSGFCVLAANGCSPLFSDFVTGNCVTKCSSGYWGYTGNYSCNQACPNGTGLFGYASATERTCYLPNNIPDNPKLFGDSESG